MKKYFLIFLVLFLNPIDSFCEELELFNQSIYNSLNSTKDFKVLGEKIRTRANAEIAKLNSESKLTVQYLYSLIDLMHFASMEDTATGQKRTKEIFNQWSKLLSLAHKGKLNAVSFWTFRIENTFNRLEKSAESPYAYAIFWNAFVNSQPKSIRQNSIFSYTIKNCQFLRDWALYDQFGACLSDLNQLLKIRPNPDALVPTMALFMEYWTMTKDVAKIRAMVQVTSNIYGKLFASYADRLEKKPLEVTLKSFSAAMNEFKDPNSVPDYFRLKLELGYLFLSVKDVKSAEKVFNELDKSTDDYKIRAYALKIAILTSLQKWKEALEVAKDLYVYPKQSNQLRSATFDAYKCGLIWLEANHRVAECKVLSEQYSKRTIGSQKPHWYYLSLINFMKVVGQKKLSPAEKSEMISFKSKLEKNAFATEPLLNIMSEILKR